MVLSSSSSVRSPGPMILIPELAKPRSAKKYLTVVLLVRVDGTSQVLSATEVEGEPVVSNEVLGDFAYKVADGTTMLATRSLPGDIFEAHSFGGPPRISTRAIRPAAQGDHDCREGAATEFGQFSVVRDRGSSHRHDSPGRSVLSCLCKFLWLNLRSRELRQSPLKERSQPCGTSSSHLGDHLKEAQRERQVLL